MESKDCFVEEQDFPLCVYTDDLTIQQTYCSCAKQIRKLPGKTKVNKSFRGNMIQCGYIYATLTIILSFYASLTTSTQSPINVSLGFITPLDKSLGPLSVLGNELESAFKLAVEVVNRDATDVWIRSDFSVSVQDESANSRIACKELAKYFDDDDRFVGLVGAYSSQCSDAIQEVLHSSDSLLPQISYRSPSLKFLDRTKFPNFYRTTSNNGNQAQVVVDLIKHFRWTKASIIHTTDVLYGKELSDEIVSKFKLSGISLNERVSFAKDDSLLKIDDILQTIKTSGSRINIIVAQGDDIFTVFRQIKNKKMFGDGWVWICTDGGASLNLGADKDVNETADGLVAVAPELFKGKEWAFNVMIPWFGKSKEDFPGIIWKTASPSALRISPYVGQVFRAVSAYHTLLTQLVKDGNITAQSSGKEIRALLSARLRTMNNLATSVPSIFGTPLYFDQNTDDRPRYTLLNYVNGEFLQVGRLDSGIWDGERVPRLNIPAGSITWPGGGTMTPTDKGQPGKALFRIGFVAPIHPALGVLSAFGKELVSAFKVALAIINSDPNNEVELDGIIKDEGVDGISSCHRAAEEIDQLNIVAVVGAYRSECSIKIHDVLGLQSRKVPIISYGATSKLLSNKTSYPHFFRVVPSNRHESELLREIVRKYGFKQVSTLYSDEISSMEIAHAFENLLRKDTVTITTSKKFPQNSNSKDLRKYVEEVLQSGSRVILVSCQQNDAVSLFQVIKELQMAGKGWIWLASSTASATYFPSSSSIGNTLEGTLGVFPKHGDGALYLRLLSSWLQKDKFQYPGVIHSSPGDSSLPYTAQVYDSVNAIALALSDLVSRKLISHKSDALIVRNLLQQKLKTYNSHDNGFPSATGTDAKVFFNSHQNGNVFYNIVNLLQTKWKRVGTFTKDKENVLLEFSSDPLFPGGTTIPVIGPGKLRYQVAAFLPKHEQLGTFSDLGHIWESALKAAVRFINKNDTLTVGFDLTVYDSGFDAENCTYLTKVLPSNVDVIIGPARSDCLRTFYDGVRDTGVPVLAYAATSSVFSKETLYPNLFRFSSSDRHQAVAMSDLIEKYLWEKVGIIAARGSYGKELNDELRTLLQYKGISVTTTELFTPGSSRMKESMIRLKQSGSGVNVVIANPNDALQLYQEAFELGMVGKGWTWLGSDGAISTLFKRAQNLQRAMQGMVGFRPKVGQGKLFDLLYKEWMGTTTDTYRQIPYVAQIFDSILVPAMTLHDLHEQKEITPKTSKSDARKTLLSKLKSMDTPSKTFKSTTGSQLHFDPHQDIVTSYDLVNLNGEDWVQVGTYGRDQLDITNNIVWAGGTVTFPPSTQPDPHKEITREESSSGTSHGLIVLAVVFSVFGLLVIVFMIYIVRRVRYRHLYMQSDLNQGGVFSVLYGHTVNRPGVNLLSQVNGKGERKGELNDPMMPRHV